MKKILPILMSIILLSSCAWMPWANKPAVAVSETDLPEEADAEPREKLGFQGGNINTGGYMCDGGGDGFVYYRSESAGADSWTLYKARYNGTAKQKLSDAQPQCINVLDGWVYFISGSADEYVIIKVRKDGTEAQELAVSSYGGLYVAESGMYFDVPNDHGTIDVARADLDGGNLHVLIPDASIEYYFNGEIYYANASGLYVCSLATGKSKLLTESYTHNVTVDGTGVYYWAVNQNGFVRRDMESGAEAVLVTGSEYYSYADGYLYYAGQGPEDWPGSTLMRLNLLTGVTDVLFKSSGEYFNGSGEWLGIHLTDDLTAADPLVLDQYGAVKGSTESAGEVYSCGGHVYMRGVTRDSALKKGIPLCIVKLTDGEVRLWD